MDAIFIRWETAHVYAQNQCRKTDVAGASAGRYSERGCILGYKVTVRFTDGTRRIVQEEDL